VGLLRHFADVLDLPGAGAVSPELSFQAAGHRVLAPNIGVHEHSHKHERSHGKRPFHRSLLVKGEEGQFHHYTRREPP